MCQIWIVDPEVPCSSQGGGTIHHMGHPRQKRPYGCCGVAMADRAAQGRAAGSCRFGRRQSAFSANQVFMRSISATCASMISSARTRICGSAPCASSTSAMSMAP